MELVAGWGVVVTLVIVVEVGAAVVECLAFVVVADAAVVVVGIEGIELVGLD